MALVAEVRPITPQQCSKARELLGWTQDRLAREVGLGAPHISHFERHNYLPFTQVGFPDWRTEIQAVLEAAGVKLIEANGDAEVGLKVA
jgi:transcriptional regulator with XRE-family HTH domain